MEESRWFAGVDTHADTHALCVVDEAEHVVYTGEFADTRKGFAALERALKGPDKCVRVAIEACGSYGRGLAEHLRERGYEVVEALRPGARAFSPDGKTDAIDAERDAKLAARGQGSRRPRPFRFSSPPETERSPRRRRSQTPCSAWFAAPRPISENASRKSVPRTWRAPSSGQGRPTTTEKECFSR